MRVLVTGATGFIGSHLVPALLEAGHDVVALTRDARGYDPASGVEVRAGDLLDPTSLEGVFDGIDAAYYLVHSMETGGDFAARDRRAASQFASAASASGVSRVVYLGGLGETGEELSEHLRSRREVESILAEGAYELTTLRAAIIVGAGSQSFRMILDLVRRLPVMITPRWVRTPCQPIAVTDVVEYLVRVLEIEETAGETFEIGGPDVLSYEDMLRTTGRILGREPIILPAPVLSPRLSTYWVDLVTDVSASVAHPLIDGLRTPVVVTDDRITELIDLDLTPYELAVRRAVGVDE